MQKTFFYKIHIEIHLAVESGRKVLKYRASYVLKHNWKFCTEFFILERSTSFSCLQRVLTHHRWTPLKASGFARSRLRIQALRWPRANCLFCARKLTRCTQACSFSSNIFQFLRFYTGINNGSRVVIRCYARALAAQFFLTVALSLFTTTELWLLYTRLST